MFYRKMFYRKREEMRYRRNIITAVILIGVTVTILLIHRTLFAENVLVSTQPLFANQRQAVQHQPKITRTTLVVDGQRVFMSESEFGLQASMAATGTLRDLFPFAEAGTYTSHPMEDALGKLLAQRNASDQPIPIAGPSTAGGAISVVGKQVKLTEDVFIAAVIVGITCLVGDPCLQPPIYILEHGKTGHRLAISSITGQVGDPSIPAAEIAALKQEFASIVVQIEKKISDHVG